MVGVLAQQLHQMHGWIVRLRGGTVRTDGRIVQTHGPDPAERSGPRASDLLAWFMRFVAVVWIAKGLMHWSVVLGVGAAPGRGFEDLPLATQGATILFSVIDPIAGVGLWMVSAWGGVVWIVAAGLHAAIDLMAPGVFGRQAGFVTAAVALIALYAGLTVLAAREGRRS